jgi:hypothetical protein
VVSLPVPVLRKNNSVDPVGPLAELPGTDTAFETDESEFSSL